MKIITICFRAKTPSNRLVLWRKLLFHVVVGRCVQIFSTHNLREDLFMTLLFDGYQVLEYISISINHLMAAK